MAFFDKFLGQERKEEKGEGASPAAAVSRRILLKNAEGAELAKLSGEEKVELLVSRADNNIRIVKRRAEEKPETIVTFLYPDNSVIRKELTDMLGLVIIDIRTAQRRGEDIEIPVNRYDLFMYMKHRPMVDVDMEKLEEELGREKPEKTGPMQQEFLDAVSRNCQVEIFYTRNTLVEDTAVRVLKQGFRMNKQVRFHDMTVPERYVVFWTDLRIQKLIRENPNVPMIGVGIVGRKPKYGLDLSSTKQSSALRKASALVRHPMNIREEMIDAQELRNAAGVWDTAVNRSKGEDFIRKFMLELAVEEASYRMPTEAAQRIADYVRRSGYNEGRELDTLRVERIDRKMLLNLLHDAEKGFAAESPEGFVCYRDITNDLVERFGWRDQGNGWVSSPKDVKPEILRKETALVLMECRYIRSMRELLLRNRQKPIAEAYQSIQNFVLENRKAGIDEEMQIALLKQIEGIEENSYGMSLENMIHDVLSDEDLSYTTFARKKEK